ncbi:Ankyrin repeat-containing protein P16F5.05c like [Verticillium longisporum]|uniref:Ankyrin repeat-containing protein P16F5.05c like n=2 Tax=Verticillium TaxID=1036719 RepID=A0A8I2ZXR8_VERLO|nr:Serine/threonine-protein kinase ssp1 [Verticillium dahliae VDG1]KAG7139832.1 Ankyrin repeat-containing protein P16F5.05c like [Verticillium longisporum]PNH47876.1 hypothetical protein VD0004_g554 [Verticillium dahliae]PNH76846.1 hypothetical protein VD0001_g724 [Verticillium dahliae]RBQ97150.1 hypothetical protein VDGD_09358 [Verticillium dahliae]
MAPNLTEDEVDDLIYFARAGEQADLAEALATLSARESVAPGVILTAARDESKATCLHMAAGNGNLDVVSAILAHFAQLPAKERKAALDQANEFANTALHWACLRGHLSVVKALLEAGASPALANDKDEIPLDCALFAEKQDVVDHFMGLSRALEGDNGEGGLSSGVGSVEVEVEETKAEPEAGKSSSSDS